jgi:hypothetical protein
MVIIDEWARCTAAIRTSYVTRIGGNMATCSGRASAGYSPLAEHRKKQREQKIDGASLADFTRQLVVASELVSNDPNGGLSTHADKTQSHGPVIQKMDL